MLHKTINSDLCITSILYMEFPLVPEHLLTRWQQLPTFTMLHPDEIADCLAEPVRLHAEIVSFTQTATVENDMQLAAFKEQAPTIASAHRLQFWAEQDKRHITFGQALQMHHAW